MKRTIIKIDEALCNGCGDCVQGCHEGALQLINGKAVMISENYCDGLGACIGDCPVGAITLEEREAVPFSEEAVKERIAVQEEGEKLPHSKNPRSFKPSYQACPSTANTVFSKPSELSLKQSSELRQFPVQLHLLNPQASYFHGAQVLLAADCTAFSLGDFHSKYLKGKMLAIACPKLDSNTDRYLEKLKSMIEDAKIDTLTVLIMEVPCCGGLVGIATKARDMASRNIPIKVIIVTVQGEVKSENWI